MKLNENAQRVVLSYMFGGEVQNDRAVCTGVVEPGLGSAIENIDNSYLKMGLPRSVNERFEGSLIILKKAYRNRRAKIQMASLNTLRAALAQALYDGLGHVDAILETLEYVEHALVLLGIECYLLCTESPVPPTIKLG